MESAEYNSILEGLSDPAFLLDLKLKPLYFNGAFIQMMGVRQRQLLNLLDEKNTIFGLMGLNSEEEIGICNRSIDNCESVHITEKILKNPKGDTFTGMESYIPVLSFLQCPLSALCAGLGLFQLESSQASFLLTADTVYLLLE